jgi:tetratricopeptide (TPR) repeat protein
MERLLTVSRVDRSPGKKDDKVSMLYAQGWPLTHMLFLHEAYAPKLSDFLAAVAAGESGEAAFLEVYGKTLKQVKNDLRGHVSGHTIPIAVFPATWDKWEQSIEVRPATELESGLVLADLLLSRRKYEDAQKEYARLAGKYPDTSDIEVGFARLADESEEAITHYRRAFELGGEDPFAHFDYARRLMRREESDEEETLAHLDKAGRLKADFNDAHLLLAAYAERDGDRTAELKYRNRAERLEASVAFQFFQRLWEISLKEGNTQEMEATVKRAKGFVMTFDDAREAERMARGRSAATPSSPSRLELAEDVLSKGDGAAAAKHLTALTQEYPRVPEFHAKLAEAHAALGDQAQAAAHRDRARRAARDNVLLAKRDAADLVRRLYLFHDAGFHPRAHEIHDKLMALRPENWVRANNYAYTLAQRGYELDKALESAQRAVELKPNRPGVLDTLGWVYVKMERSKEAVETFERVVELRPDNAIYQYHFGVALLQAGTYVQAKRAFTTALKRKPSESLEKRIREKLAETEGRLAMAN